MSCTEGAIDGGLFAAMLEEERSRLMGSPLGGLLPGEGVADLFCGAGGWGEGAKRHGIRVGAAVNHWGEAIATHARNNEGCAHHLGDAWRARPRDVMRAAGITSLGVLLASAACTSHSKAKGGAPIAPRVHMLGWCIARWLEEGSPRLAWIENVPEWKDWGPLIHKRSGRSGFAWERVYVPARRGGLGTKKRTERLSGPSVYTPEGRRWAKKNRRPGETLRAVLVQDPARKGQHFRRWWRFCERLGYRMEMRVLDAPDYGAASRRTRLYIQARRDGMPLVWPERTHGNEATARRSRDDGHAAGQGAQWGVAGGREGHSRCDEDDRRRPVDDARAGGLRSASGAGGGTGDGGAEAPPREGCQLARRASGRVLKPYRAAAEIIDWSDLGTSIFERPRPLKPKTLARVAEGIRRFVLNDPRPFVLRVTQTGGGWQVWPVDEPMPGQTTRQDIAVCTPIVAPQNSGVFGQRVDQPGPSITTKGHQSLITPILASAGGSAYAGKVRRIDALLNTVKTDNRQCLVSPVMVTTGYGERDGQRPRCQDIRDPLNTVVAQCAKQAVVAPVMACLRNNVAPSRPDEGPIAGICAGGTHHALVAALLCEYYGSGSGKTLRRADGPLGCVTTLDRHALVTVLIDGLEFVIIDILFRMLRPHELAAAMGFPAGYLWPKSQRDATRLIGNAVHVDVAAALIGASLPRGVIEGEWRAVA